MREIQELLQRKRHLLTLAAGLADGGARVGPWGGGVKGEWLFVLPTSQWPAYAYP
jgi:hypothetical protein